MQNGLATIEAPATVGTITTSAQLAFEPSDIAGAIRLAGILVASKLLPDSIRTPEAAFTIIMTGRELGLTAMQSIRSIHIIKGRPVMSADLMAALVKRSPECLYFQMIESTDAIATYETHRRGDKQPTRLSFTSEQAKTAGLMGNENWRKYPSAMLRARCIAALARAVYPDSLLGVYETDELSQNNVVPEPAPAREYEATGEVVEQRRPVQVNEPHTHTLALELLAAYDAAKTSSEVAAVSARVVESRSQLTEEHVSQLRSAREEALSRTKAAA